MDKKTFKQELLDELYAPYQQCMKCPLGSLGRTHVVFGTGNPDADLMLIGEGPGNEEDKQGKPFVGRSGQLLTKLLHSVGIERHDTFITNIVKCRPPNNRKPFPIESSTCKAILLIKQIKIIRPRLICTLGATALECLLDKPVKITQARGKEFLFENIKVIATYHPAYILRNPKEVEPMLNDLTKVASLLGLISGG